MPAFPTPIPGPPGTGSPTNDPPISTSYNLVTAYLMDLIDLSASTEHYDIFIEDDGLTYAARRGDVDDVVDSDTDVGALINRLFGTGGVSVRLKTPGTYNTSTTILPIQATSLVGLGPETVIKAATNLGSATSYMVDCYNGRVGRKWVQIMDVWFDCNGLVYGGLRALGVQSDTTAYSMFFRNSFANFVTVGIRADDFDASGGTRQFIWANKIGPGKSGSPTRGLELRLNDVHTWKNDIFLVTDVGIYVSSRGATDKSVGTCWILDNHVAVGNYVAGGVSPDTAPVNIFVDTGLTSLNIYDNYLDNIKRYPIYVKPTAGFKVTGLDIERNWFNGSKLVDVSGSDKAVALVLDATNVKSGDIYGVKFINNRGSTGYSKTANLKGRWKYIVALINGLTTGNNYTTVDGSHFRGSLALWDPAGARPDKVGDSNLLQPAVNNTSQGKFSRTKGLFTTLTNLLANPDLQANTVTAGIPDNWVRTAGSLTGSMPGGSVWRAVYNPITQFLYQDVPVVADGSTAYSVSAVEQVTVDAAGTEKARIALQFFDAYGIQTGSFNDTSTPAGVQGAPETRSLNNKVPPVDTLTTHGAGTMALSGTTLTATTGTFPSSAEVVGAVITVTGAGSADGSTDLVTTISAWTNTTHVTLASPCLNTAGVADNWALGGAGTVGGTSSGTALVAATGTFTSLMANQQIILTGAGVAGVDLITTITTVTDGTHVTLADAITTVTAGAAWTIPTLIWGKGDSTTLRLGLKGNGSTSPETIEWADARVCVGANTNGQSGANTTWTIPHGLPGTPSGVILTPANSVAAGAGGYVSAVDATNITVTTSSVTGPSWYWEARL